ncbi:MAG TPA: dienelactone hydrolase family protein [Candidatus Binatia bacterium]|nr:dienelactone hydrolase family protein [Candidatus Binatia bacterium]
MCDERTERDDAAFLERTGQTRRRFGALSLAALAACATPPSDPHEVREQDVRVTTPDGVADAYFVHPATGRHAGVLMWPDIRGIRPAFRTMGKRLAQSGYAVLVVNPYYRTRHGVVVTEGESFSDPPVRERLMGLRNSLTPQTQETDGRAFVQFLDAQRVVDTRRKLGVMGYCMTGAFMLRTAAAVPERVGAGASFHGGGLVTDSPESPHLLASRVRGGYLFAIAQNDDEAEPNTKTVLRDAFAAANVPAEIEVYPARHGWCVLDGQAHDQVQADRAWARCLALFSTALA